MIEVHIGDSRHLINDVGEFCRKNDRHCIIFELNPTYEPLIIESGMVDTPVLDSFKTDVVPEK